MMTRGKGGGSRHPPKLMTSFMKSPLLAPKVLLEDHWPMMTMLSHPIHPKLSALQCLRGHSMTLNLEILGRSLMNLDEPRRPKTERQRKERQSERKTIWISRWCHLFSLSSDSLTNDAPWNSNIAHLIYMYCCGKPMREPEPDISWTYIYFWAGGPQHFRVECKSFNVRLHNTNTYNLCHLVRTNCQ